MTQFPFRFGDVEISQTVARFGPVSYPIANIGSVDVRETKDMPGLGLVLVGGFVLTVIVGIIYPSFLVTLVLLAAVFSVAFFLPFSQKGEAILILKT